MKKKALSMILTCSAVISLLAGCGGSATQPETSEGTSGDASAVENGEEAVSYTHLTLPTIRLV